MDYLPHPNLSPEINAALASVKDMIGLFLRDLPTGHVAQVRTKNSTYVVSHDGTVVGDKRQGASVTGSTFGGSMIRVGWVGEGMYLEMQTPEGTVTTTRIEDVNIIKEPVGGSPPSSAA